MTEKLYEVDSYVQNFTAQVVSCTPVPGGFAVVLDRTAFFPEGGGQPCDTGRLGGARVLAVHTDGETITHTTDAPLAVGETVDGCLNWPARLDAMQQHTGEHILSGALHRLFGAENVGFHIGSPYVRMDTNIPLTPEQLAEVPPGAEPTAFWGMVTECGTRRVKLPLTLGGCRIDGRLAEFTELGKLMRT